MDSYPECEKLSTKRTEMMAIRSFMDFVGEKEIILTDTRLKYHASVRDRQLEDLMYEFYDINPKEVEIERRKMLDSLVNDKKELS